MKELSIENQIYLCKYHDIIRDYDLRTTMGLNRQQANELIEKYKNNGLYEQYKNLSESEYDMILNKSKKPPKNKFEKMLEKYNFNSEKVGYELLIKLLEYLNANKKKSIIDGYAEVARHYKDKDEISIRNAIYRLVSEKKISLSEILKDEIEWIGPDKKGFVAVKENTENKVENEKTVISDITSEKVEKMETSNDHIPTIEKGFVKVPIKTLMNWSYMKGQLDTILDYQRREELKRKVED